MSDFDHWCDEVREAISLRGYDPDELTFDSFDLHSLYADGTGSHVAADALVETSRRNSR